MNVAAIVAGTIHFTCSWPDHPPPVSPTFCPQRENAPMQGKNPSMVFLPPWPEYDALQINLGKELIPEITVHYDGTVVLRPGVTLDEASKAFWDAVEHFGFGQGARIRQLEEELRKKNSPQGGK